MAAKKRPEISIIIVQYHARAVLLKCIESIIKSTRTSYDIIVVDNDEKKTIEEDIRKFKGKVSYVKNPTNSGFGSGVNLGARYIKGEYVCFLNPDVIILNHAIDKLYNFISKQKNAGIVSAIMLNKRKEIPTLQGAAELTPLNAIFSFSLISKLFPNNPIAKKFWRYKWEVTKPKQTSSVPLGTAMVKREIFENVGMFDERFFLYYEDFDLCKRVEAVGFKNYLLPDAQVIHFGGEGGTKAVKDLDKVFNKSRFQYFEKYYGFFTAFSVNGILSIGKRALVLGVILFFTIELLSYRLSELMVFIGDQGWLYLSARDLLLIGNIPVVGITSSHTWFHQAPLWTYILAGTLWISNWIMNVYFGGGGILHLVASNFLYY